MAILALETARSLLQRRGQMRGRRKDPGSAALHAHWIDDSLAVDDELPMSVLSRLLDDPQIAVGPVVAAPGDIELKAAVIAVALDLVEEPVRAFRNDVGRGGDAELKGLKHETKRAAREVARGPSLGRKRQDELRRRGAPPHTRGMNSLQKCKCERLAPMGLREPEYRSGHLVVLNVALAQLVGDLQTNNHGNRHNRRHNSRRGLRPKHRRSNSTETEAASST